MPAPVNTAELLELLRKSALIDPPRLETFLQTYSRPQDLPAPRHLASLLIDAALLTNFQAEQLLLGKWRGYTIGKYKVLERLGFGGHGTVYLCEHMVVHRRVAVKVLPTGQAENRVLLSRFYREARAAGVLNHPNLLKAHDIDQDNGFHFLVMEYVDGANLQEIVSRFGPLSLRRAAHYIRQTAEGLHYAHQVAGLVHRDIKPANILLDRTGLVRVLDLGLVRFFHDNLDCLTLQYDGKNVLGTADYVSPEQALNSHDVDIRADIYSLGATFYFLLTGQTPFPDGKATQKLIWHQVKQPVPVRKLRPEIPEGLAAVVEKMLAKKREERYQTPAEVIEALAPWTVEPIGPPSEVEMPRLSPAARAAAPGECDPGPQTPTRAPSDPRARSGSAARTAPMPALGHLVETSVPKLSPPKPQRQISLADPATPRMQAAQLSHDTDRDLKAPAQAAPPVCPSEKLAASQKPARTFGDSLWRLATIVLASILIGILVRLWMR